jgi:hypothetical protein
MAKSIPRFGSGHLEGCGHPENTGADGAVFVSLRPASPPANCRRDTASIAFGTMMTVPQMTKSDRAIGGIGRTVFFTRRTRQHIDNSPNMIIVRVVLFTRGVS